MNMIPQFGDISLRGYIAAYLRGYKHYNVGLDRQQAFVMLTEQKAKATRFSVHF